MYTKDMKRERETVEWTPTGLMRFVGFLLLSATTAIGVVSCSGSDDTVSPAPTLPTTETAISFKSGLADNEEVTRSEGLEQKVETFKVWSYKNMSVNDKGNNDISDDEYGNVQTVMPGYIVNYVANTAMTTTSNTHDWEYVNQQASGTEEQTIKYWDWSAKAYRFFGVAGGDSQNYGAHGVNNTNTAYSMTLTVDASSDNGIAATPYYSHLWFSNGNTTVYPDKEFGKFVQLEFLKPIAQVRFIFTFVPELTAAGVDRTQLSSIMFKPTASDRAIANQGTVTISYPLTGIEDKESFTSNATGFFNYFNTDSYEENGTWHNTWYNVLPRDSQDSFTLSVVVIGGEPKTCVVPAEYMTWAPGYQYTYIFKIMESGGVTLDDIQVAINDWHVKEQVTHPVYNW